MSDLNWKSFVGRSCLIAVVVALFVGRLSAAETLSPVSPADAGLSAEVLQQGVKLFAEAVERDDIRGAVVLVARDGRIALHEAVGWRNKRRESPMLPDTLFRMASNTKAVVATAVLILQEEGKLLVDDEVCKHLPAFDNEQCRGMTIKHLLTHTSGLRIPTLFVQPLLEKSDEHPDAPNLLLEVNRFAEIGPEVAPGRTYKYNNPGYNTLGAIIEVCSQQPLEEFLTDRIYRPLGMHDTSNRPVESKYDRLSVIYARKDEKWTVRLGQNGRTRVPFVRASGGMISTAGDYVRFCQMYLDGGTLDGVRVLSPESVAAATSPQTRSILSPEEAAKNADFYGFGWRVAADGTYSHGGSDGTFAWIDPARRLIVLVFTQSPGGKLPRSEFIELVNSACLETE